MLLDGHVHIYPVFDLAVFFDTALGRAERHGAPLLLLLTETTGADWFERLRRRAEGRATPANDALAPLFDPGSGRLRVRCTAEASSVAVEDPRRPGTRLYLVAGRQKVARERLEVLALALDPGDPLNGAPDRSTDLEELVDRALEAGAAAAVPWGFGKWLGSRGARVAALAAREPLRRHPLFFLGDVAHRSWPWRPPRAFRSGARILAGTDPLPLPGAERQVAAYTTRVEAPLDPERPAESLRAAFRSGAALEITGRRSPPMRAIAEQIAYRIRRPPPPAASGPRG